MLGSKEDDASQPTLPAHRTEEGLSQPGALRLQGLTHAPFSVGLAGPGPRFGRGADCDVVLVGGEASRHHAQIVRAGPLWLLRDLNSTNGTFLNGERVSEAALTPGSIVRMGDWLAVVRTEAGSDTVLDASFQMHGPGLWGGAGLRAALLPLRAVAESALPVVLEGETGTGKELVARALHALSGRSGPFVAVNCAALPEALAEGELFGYRRGAFTGAERANPGHFRSAHGGTLLLDEICDLPLGLQVKLLRVLEQREVVPLGESTPVPIDVRVVAAAQEPLRLAVEQRRFRADLYARLDGLGVRLPPLRERVEDVAPLLTHFMTEQGCDPVPSLTTNALEAMLLYDWPFNVRELRLLAQRLVLLLARQPSIHRRDLPERMRSEAQRQAAVVPAQREGTELERLLAALRENRGNVSQAARAAGISRMRAYRLMNAHPEVEVAAFRRAVEHDA